MLNRNKKAFTLIELIVVIAILAILAVALIPLINNFIEKSRISRLMTTSSTLETSAIAFNADVATFPDADGEERTFTTTELVANPSKANWDGPYLNRNTEGVSPWGSDMTLQRRSFRGVGQIEDEYVLIVQDDEKGANIPDASKGEIDKKVDGNPGQSGKVLDFGDELNIVIVTDAYGEDVEEEDDGGRDR